GLLAVLHIAPMQLVPIAVVVFGSSLLMGHWATSRVSALSFGATPEVHAVAREAALAAASSQMLVGIGAVTLGIIAIVGIEATTLTLAALLALGASLVLSGTTVGSTMMSFGHALVPGSLGPISHSVPRGLGRNRSDAPPDPPDEASLLLGVGDSGGGAVV